MAFNFDAYNSIAGPLGIQLFSTLPGVSTALGLKSAAAATAKAQRSNRATTDFSGIEVKARQAEKEAAAYQRLSLRLNKAVDAATDARDTLYSLKDLLAEMRRLIVLSKDGDVTDEERRQNANTFDQLLGKLNLKVRNNGGFDGNLIGSSIRDVFTTEDVVYYTKPNQPANQTLTGVFSGSEYTITDGSGNLFFADAYGTRLDPFPFDDTVEGEVIGNTDTVSFDPDTGAISITHDGDASPFITGTVERKGLGLLHSFFYGDFTDPAKLDDALADLDAASSKLRYSITVIEGQLAKANAHSNANQSRIDENRDYGVKLQTERAIVEQKAALESQRQQLLFANAFNGATSFDASGTLLSLGIDSLFDFKV